MFELPSFLGEYFRAKVNRRKCTFITCEQWKWCPKVYVVTFSLLSITSLASVWWWRSQLCEGLAWTLAELSVNIGCEWNYCDLLFAEQHSVTIASSKWKSSLCEGFARRKARSDRSCREDLKHLLVGAPMVEKCINQAKSGRCENAKKPL